ncbi:MAG: metalloregulator ArsR/SmtB family transcription factor [Angelakisella sp.]|nr:metalloregulator ArsR/SmtB family transcription factor [Angelakisella sp.]
MEEKAKEVAELLKVLSNPNRLLILCCLAQQPLTVGEIIPFVGEITQSAVSQHLSILRGAGIVYCEKHGQNITYQIRDARVLAVMQVLKEQYCS